MLLIITELLPDKMTCDMEAVVCYFHEFKVMKKVTSTKTFILNFHKKFIKFWIILFFQLFFIHLDLISLFTSVLHYMTAAQYINKTIIFTCNYPNSVNISKDLIDSNSCEEKLKDWHCVNCKLINICIYETLHMSWMWHEVKFVTSLNLEFSF